MPETREPQWPWCIVTSDAKPWPGVIIRWETGHGQSPGEWHAVVAYVKAGELVQEIVPAGRITRSDHVPPTSGPGIKWP